MVVLAAGLSTAALVDPIDAGLPLGGVQGSALLTAPMPPTLRGLVTGALVAYQRRDGRVVLATGWTPMGAGPPPDVGERLIRHAATRLPAVAGARVETSWWGVRPAPSDGLPVIDEIAPGLHVCCGHGGEGFTSGPGAARLVARMALAEDPDVDPTPFRADRFPAAQRRGVPA